MYNYVKILHQDYLLTDFDDGGIPPSNKTLDSSQGGFDIVKLDSIHDLHWFSDYVVTKVAILTQKCSFWLEKGHQQKRLSTHVR